MGICCGTSHPFYSIDPGLRFPYDGKSALAFPGHNIRSLDIEAAIKTLSALEPVRFNYKTSPEEESLGFIAEDVPELLTTKDSKSLDPMDIVTVLTKVTQEQQRVNQEQQKEIQKQQRIAEQQQKIISELIEEVKELKREVKLKGSLASVMN